MLLKIITDQNRIEWYQNFLGEFVPNVFKNIPLNSRYNDYYIDINEGVLNLEVNDYYNLTTINEISKSYPQLSLFLFSEIVMPESSYNYETGLYEDQFCLLFCLFKNGKCSHLLIEENYMIDEKLYPTLNDYLVYLLSSNINDPDFIPDYFNVFEETGVLFQKIKEQGIYHSYSIDYPKNYSFFIKELIEKFNKKDTSKKIDTSFNLPIDLPSQQKFINLDMLSDDSLPDFLVSPKKLINSLIPGDNYTIVIDTETDGLPTDFDSDFPYYSYPKIVQISWAIFDNKNRIVKIRDYIIKPDDYTISAESTIIHGISNAKALAFGKHLENVLSELDYDLSECNLLVGHNLEYDIKSITINAHWAAIKTDGFDLGFFNKHKNHLRTFCTMKDSMQFLNEIGFKKWLKLGELYQHLFSEVSYKNHNSLNDVWYTSKCFFELQSQYSNSNYLDFIDIGYVKEK